ncbi:MAG: nucleotidyltransferase domain-containing protein [Bacteroides sp.]|nr:nucleotidyltransferase domain-containing protein [Bacteroides sp.]
MHKIIAQEIMDLLHRSFPEAGIAVSGSVAAGTYQPDSDIDLLFVRREYQHPWCIHFAYKGYDISLFSFHLDTLRKEKDQMTGHYFAMPISYIYHARIAYDPLCLIEDLKEEVDYILRKRRILRNELADQRRKDLHNLLHTPATSLWEQKMLSDRMIDAIVSVFFLSRHADKLISKKETGEIFSLMEQENKELADILNKCLPWNQNSYLILKNHGNNIEKCLSTPE